MKKSLKIFLIVIAIIILMVGGYLSYLSLISMEKMQYCETEKDCVAVMCECYCSGCGGFSYEDVVNKKYWWAWHFQQSCLPAAVCPEACCLPRTIACEDNVCVVKEGISNN